MGALIAMMSSDHHLAGVVVGLALLAAHCVVSVSIEDEARVSELLDDAEGNPHLAALHTQNHGLLKQIDDVQNGRTPSPMAAQVSQMGPTGPAPMPGMMAMGTPSASGDGRMMGIKEALTAVKPIMDKYVNTAKVLTGKYSKLKKAFNVMKKAGKHDPALKAHMDAAMRKVEDEDKKKMEALKKKYGDLKKEELLEKQAADSKELTLEQKIGQLSATNQAVAKSFMTELDAAKGAAKKQVHDMRLELDRFMSDTSKDKFDELGEATSKALEEKKALKLKNEKMQSAVRDMLAKAAKQALGEPNEDSEKTKHHKVKLPKLDGYGDDDEKHPELEHPEEEEEHKEELAKIDDANEADEPLAAP